MESTEVSVPVSPVTQAPRSAESVGVQTAAEALAPKAPVLETAAVAATEEPSAMNAMETEAADQVLLAKVASLTEDVRNASQEAAPKDASSSFAADMAAHRQEPDVMKDVSVPKVVESDLKYQAILKKVTEKHNGQTNEDVTREALDRYFYEQADEIMFKSGGQPPIEDTALYQEARGEVKALLRERVARGEDELDGKEINTRAYALYLEKISRKKKPGKLKGLLRMFAELAVTLGISESAEAGRETTKGTLQPSR